MTPRSRLPYWVIEFIAFLGLPILLPCVGFWIAFDTWGRALGWPKRRRPGLVNRIWWVYGYHGLYQIDWWMKRRSGRVAP